MPPIPTPLRLTRYVLAANSEVHNTLLGDVLVYSVPTVVVLFTFGYFFALILRQRREQGREDSRLSPAAIAQIEGEEGRVLGRLEEDADEHGSREVGSVDGVVEGMRGHMEMESRRKGGGKES